MVTTYIKFEGKLERIFKKKKKKRQVSGKNWKLNQNQTSHLIVMLWR